MMTGDPEVSRIFWDGIEDRESLSKADRRRFDTFLSMTWQAFTQQWEHHRRGHSTATSWDQTLLGVRWQCGRPGTAQWWKEYRGLYSPAFSDFVDGIFREAEAAE